MGNSSIADSNRYDIDNDIGNDKYRYYMAIDGE